jgi:hypothetical protein
LVQRPPKVISRKLEYLRGAVGLEEMKPFASDLEPILKLFAQLIEARHFIVHGIFGENSEGVTVFAKPTITIDNMHMTHFVASTATILEHDRIARTVTWLASRLALRLAEPLNAEFRKATKPVCE